MWACVLLWLPCPWKHAVVLSSHPTPADPLSHSPTVLALATVGNSNRKGRSGVKSMPSAGALAGYIGVQKFIIRPHPTLTIGRSCSPYQPDVTNSHHFRAPPCLWTAVIPSIKQLLGSYLLWLGSHIPWTARMSFCQCLWLRTWLSQYLIYLSYCPSMDSSLKSSLEQIKFKKLKLLVQEQLQIGHREPQLVIWTPLFRKS